LLVNLDFNQSDYRVISDIPALILVKLENARK